MCDDNKKEIEDWHQTAKPNINPIVSLFQAFQSRKKLNNRFTLILAFLFVNLRLELYVSLAFKWLNDSYAVSFLFIIQYLV